MVTILGLSSNIVDLEEAYTRPIWTVNDWWKHYPTLVPSAVFQVHKPEALDNLERYNGWRAHYADTYTTTYTCYEHGFLQDERIMSPEFLAEQCDVRMYQSSVNYMLALAHARCHDVAIRGVHMLTCGERAAQLRFMIDAIDLFRGKGMTIDVDPSIEWLWRNAVPVIDWKIVRDLVPYHVREQYTPLSLTMKPCKLTLPVLIRKTT